MKDAVDKFLEELKNSDLDLHSMALIYDGEVVDKRYFEPFREDTLQRMYSVSKSFVSIAIGFLQEEGKLRLSDPILSFFEEYSPEIVCPELARMTIEDMLRMETCHAGTTYKSNPKEPWVPSFFSKKPHHEPGMIFMYDTSSSDTLCALAERLSGKEILTYLREKCLDEIGFSREAYVMRNGFDEAMGGSGLMATTDDLVKFAILLMSGGKFRGRQLLPKGYIKQATSFQTATRMRDGVREERQGYGYQFWRLTHNGFGCYGKGGQFILCYPDKKLALVTTADTTDSREGNQVIFNSLYRNIFPAVTDEKRICGEENESCADRIGIFLPGEGKRYECQGGAFWDWLEFREEKVIFGRKEERYELAVGWEEAVKGRFPLYGHECMTRAVGLDHKSIYLQTRFLGEYMASFVMQASFRDDRLLCYMKNTQDFDYEEFKGWIQARR